VKKYTHLYPGLVKRITNEEAGKKDAAKAVKTRLHQLYGAYVQPSAYKKAEKLLENMDNAAGVEQLLRLHASTRERLPHYPDFYEFILSKIPAPASVLDVGCGFHPFSLPYLQALLPTGQVKAYHAYDIDLRQAELINRFFVKLGLPAGAGCADLAVEIPHGNAPCVSETPPPADLAFMLKLTPVLEAQASGRGFFVARSLQARCVVVTYPLKSLGGREKGMAAFYRNAFETAYADGLLGDLSLVAEQPIGAEWVYILRRL